MHHVQVVVRTCAVQFVITCNLRLRAEHRCGVRLTVLTTRLRLRRASLVRSDRKLHVAIERLHVLLQEHRCAPQGVVELRAVDRDSVVLRQSAHRLV